MSDKTGIQWTDATWNPVTGCTKVSPGCANCYIEKTPPFRMKGIRFERGRIPVTLYPDRLDQSLRWRKPRRVFVNSMSDLFHEDVPDEFIDRVWAVMALAGCERQRCKGGSRCKHDEYESSGCWMQDEGFEQPRHTFQILTKRPERMRDYLRRRTEWNQEIYDAAEGFGYTEMGDSISALGWPLPNVWLGVSAENQSTADERIPILLDTPAAKRFVSCEPLLGPLSLASIHVGPGDQWLDSLAGRWYGDDVAEGQDVIAQSRLDWVIVGGESGGSPERALVERNTDAVGIDANQAPAHLPVLWEPKPFREAWVIDIQRQCQAAGVPFFFKQWGGPTPKAGGRTLDGRTWDEFPERVAVPA